MPMMVWRLIFKMSSKSIRTNATPTWCPGCFNQKPYKSLIISNIGMLPSDPSGSLDEIFYRGVRW